MFDFDGHALDRLEWLLVTCFSLYCTQASWVFPVLWCALSIKLCPATIQRAKCEVPYKVQTN